MREQLLWGVHNKENPEKRGVLATGAGNRFPHRSSFFSSPVRRPFSALSLSVLSFLESSSSMGTGIAVTRQAFRHLLEGDEKNIQCGRAEERQRRRVQGTGSDWGWTSCSVGVMCGWRRMSR